MVLASDNRHKGSHHFIPGYLFLETDIGCQHEGSKDVASFMLASNTKSPETDTPV